MNIMSGSLGGGVPSLQLDNLSVLGLALNNVCPLSCAHCYLQSSELEKTLSKNEWQQFLKSAIFELRPEYLCFVGKEVFARAESVDLIFESVGLRDQASAALEGNRTQIGLITNGILAGRYVERLSNVALDWLDVSIDGTPSVHDEIRGRGMFEKTARKLERLKRAMEDKLWITNTLTERSIHSLPDFVSYMVNRFGVQNFSIGLYKPQSYTSQSLTLPSEMGTKNIINSLLRLNEISDAKDVVVNLDFDASQVELREQFVAEGLLPSSGLLRKATNTLNNGLKLGISTTEIPVGLWQSARVTHDGRWLAAEDVPNVLDYSRRTVSMLAEHQFNSVNLYHAGLSHSRLQELTGMHLHELQAAVAPSTEHRAA